MTATEREACLDRLCEQDEGYLEDEDEYDTVGGLIYHRVGGVPSPGDEVEVTGAHDLTLEVSRPSREPH